MSEWHLSEEFSYVDSSVSYDLVQEDALAVLVSHLLHFFAGQP